MRAEHAAVVGLVVLAALARARVTYADGVVVGTMTPAGAAIEAAAGRAFGSRGYPAIVTSAREGVHMAGSAHDSGNARDFRTWHVGTLAEKRAIRDDMQTELGPRFDVLLEWEPEHLHAEEDPTRGATRSW